MSEGREGEVGWGVEDGSVFDMHIVCIWMFERRCLDRLRNYISKTHNFWSE